MTEEVKKTLCEKISECDGYAYVLTCDKGGFIEMAFDPEVIEKGGVPAKLYDLLCETHKNAINWRCKQKLNETH